MIPQSRPVMLGSFARTVPKHHESTMRLTLFSPLDILQAASRETEIDHRGPSPRNLVAQQLVLFRRNNRK